MAKAFLFDIDGVLTDSADISKELVKRFFASKGKSVGDEDIIPNLGMGIDALFLKTAERVGVEINLDEALSFFKENYSALLKEKKEIPGASSFVKDARKKGILRAVVSSAPSWRVEENLSSIGLSLDDFDLVLTEKDVKRNKPYPDIYIKAMIELGVEKKDTVIFEDSLSGIKGGKESGTMVVALTTTLGREKAKLSGADAVLDSFLLFPSFTSSDDLDSALRELSGKGRNAIRYGANWIESLERKAPTKEVMKEAIDEALNAMEHAYSPYSNFNVGAAVLSAGSGRIYSGCNVENASYGATICAERNAITTAITNEGAIGIDLLVVASRCNPPAMPCAVCRQVMSEFIRPDTPIVLVNTMGVIETYKFSELLPHPFDFEAL